MSLPVNKSDFFNNDDCGIENYGLSLFGHT
jgi:hypothetical protein